MELYIDPISAAYDSYQTSRELSNVYELYPYHSLDLVVAFIYGTDFTRQRNIFIIPTSVQVALGLVVTYIILSACILYVVRRKLKLPRASMTLALMDCLVPFIGGASLRMQHRFERWFFGIQLIAAFFIMSVFGGDLIGCIIRVFESKVDTFEELAKINFTLIGLSSELRINQENIHRMLRLAHYFAKEVYKLINFIFFQIETRFKHHNQNRLQLSKFL